MRAVLMNQDPRQQPAPRAVAAGQQDKQVLSKSRETRDDL